MQEIDYDRLRNDLLDYFGTAAFSVSQLAMADVVRVENADEAELTEIAHESKWDLDEYFE